MCWVEKKNEIITMVERNEDKGVIKKNVDLFHEVLFKFKEVQVDVQNILDAEAKAADYSDWYEPKLVDF